MPPPKLTIYVAGDSWGFSLYEALRDHLRSQKHAEDVAVVDYGVYSKYYLAAHAVGLEVEKAAEEGREDVRGVLCCGSGQGMAVVANKFPRVYACLVQTPEQAAGCRSVNNANVITFGARITDADTAIAALDAWLATELGDGLEAHLQEFVKASMGEIQALNFSAGAKRELADAVPPLEEAEPAASDCAC